MYAVVQMNGHQYKVSEGSTISVDQMREKIGDEIEIKFPDISFIEKEGKISVISQLSDAKIVGRIINKSSGEKIRTFRYRRRKNTMKTKGMRPKFTTIRIEKILESSTN